jgi:hypothetical protein
MLFLKAQNYSKKIEIALRAKRVVGFCATSENSKIDYRKILTEILRAYAPPSGVTRAPGRALAGQGS